MDPAPYQSQSLGVTASSLPLLLSMGSAPWGALGGGELKTRQQREHIDRSGEGGRTLGGPSEKNLKLAHKLETIASKKKTAITGVELAYVMHKAPYVFPIISGRKIEHLKGNIDALSLEVGDEEIEEIGNAAPFDTGFPIYFLIGPKRVKGPGDILLMHAVGRFNYVEGSKPFKPVSGKE